MKEKFSYEAPFLFELTELPVNGDGGASTVEPPDKDPQEDNPGDIDDF